MIRIDIKLEVFMKKTLRMIMAVTSALLMLSFVGCKTTEVAGSGMKGKTA